MLPTDLTTSKQTQIKNTAQKFERILEKAVTPEDEKKIKESARQFESYFINTLFKEMRKTLPKTDLLGDSNAKDIFEDMLYEQYAEELSKGGGIGLADMMTKQMLKDAANLYKINTKQGK